MLTSIAKYAKLTGLVKGIVLGFYNLGSYPMEKAGGGSQPPFFMDSNFSTLIEPVS